jgi:hypothetical protein
MSERRRNFVLRFRLEEEDQLVRMREQRRAQEDGIDDAEDRHVSAGADGEYADQNRRKIGGLR